MRFEEVRSGRRAAGESGVIAVEAADFVERLRVSSGVSEWWENVDRMLSRYDEGRGTVGEVSLLTLVVWTRLLPAGRVGVRERDFMVRVLSVRRSSRLSPISTAESRGEDPAESWCLWPWRSCSAPGLNTVGMRCIGADVDGGEAEI